MGERSQSPWPGTQDCRTAATPNGRIGGLSARVKEFTGPILTKTLALKACWPAGVPGRARPRCRVGLLTDELAKRALHRRPLGDTGRPLLNASVMPAR